MTQSPLFWVVSGICAFLVGVAKTGVPGLGILVVPVLALAVGDAIDSAAWLLPLLCVADVFAVAYYRRHARARALFELAPWVVCGMALAGALILCERGLPADGTWKLVTNGGIALIVLVMVGLHLRRQLLGEREIPDSVGHRLRYGLTAGIATTLANAAGPVMNLYLLAQRLPKHEFIATGAWFFLVINLAKVPIYAGCGMFSRESLYFSLVLSPVVVLGALTGRQLFERIPQRAFGTVVVSLAALAALLLPVPRSAWVQLGELWNHTPTATSTQIPPR